MVIDNAMSDMSEERYCERIHIIVIVKADSMRFKYSRSTSTDILTAHPSCSRPVSVSKLRQRSSSRTCRRCGSAWVNSIGVDCNKP